MEKWLKISILSIGIGLLAIFLIFLTIGYFSNRSLINKEVTIFNFSKPEGTGIDGPHLFFEKNDRFSTLSFKSEENKIKISHDTILMDSEINVQLEYDPSKSFQVRVESIIPPAGDIYSQPFRILAISDIEGDFNEFEKILKAGGVINDKFQWIFTDGHLVLNGDLIDRGREVTQCLWLIYKLEQEARQKGGMVHVIIGNHELFGFKGEDFYAHDKYIEIAETTGVSYAYFFSEKSFLGTWLASKNCIEKIGDILFVHGGISPDIIQENLSLEELNGIARAHYFNTCSDFISRLVFGERGLFWYRGYFFDEKEPMLAENRLDEILKFYDAKQIVVGHTLVDSITSIYKGKIIAIDTKNFRKEALYIRKDVYYKVNEQGIEEFLLK